jgi:diaminobutyrate-2-oxoglutarate transaminase
VIVEATDYLASVESNARTYASSFQRTFVSGRGVRMFDAHGREYLDCLGCAGALPLGHQHPEVKEAILDFVSSDRIQQALDLATPAKFEFVHQLFSHLPAELRDNAKIQFCGPTGADAVEAAIKLMKFYTQRSPIIAFHGAYHGMTSGALGATGNLTAKSGTGFVNGDVHFAPFPYRFRCPFGTDGEDTDLLSLNYIRTILADPESGIPKPAAMIVEVVQGEGGVIPASDRWLRGVRELTLEYDVPLVIDEVQTGLGRTGAMFAFERAGIIPDALILSKAIGGGYPLSVLIYHRRLDVWPPGMHAGTFRGNQIAMVAGYTTMRVIERDGLARNAARIGAMLAAGFSQMAERFNFLADIRGRGLMIGIEITQRDRGRRASSEDAAVARAIKHNCFKNGLIIETGGRNSAVLRFLPPLILTESDVDEILARFERAVDDASRNLSRDLVATS